MLSQAGRGAVQDDTRPVPWSPSCSSISGQVLGETIGRLYQGPADRGLTRRMPAGRLYLQLRIGPGPMQLPGVLHRADHIVAAVDDHPGDTRQSMGIAQQLILLEEGIVREVVAFDTGHGKGKVRVAEVLHQLRIGLQGGGAPLRPGR